MLFYYSWLTLFSLLNRNFTNTAAFVHSFPTKKIDIILIRYRLQVVIGSTAGEGEKKPNRIFNVTIQKHYSHRLLSCLSVIVAEPCSSLCQFTELQWQQTLNHPVLTELLQLNEYLLDSAGNFCYFNSYLRIQMSFTRLLLT